MRYPRDKFTDKFDVEDASKIVVENNRTHCWEISGGHLMTHFQCDVCNFRNVQGRGPCHT